MIVWYDGNGEMRTKTDYLEDVMKFCHKKGITYAQFQQNETFYRLGMRYKRDWLFNSHV